MDDFFTFLAPVITVLIFAGLLIAFVDEGTKEN